MREGNLMCRAHDFERHWVCSYDSGGVWVVAAMRRLCCASPLSRQQNEEEIYGPSQPSKRLAEPEAIAPQ